MDRIWGIGLKTSIIIFVAKWLREKPYYLLFGKVYFLLIKFPYTITCGRMQLTTKVIGIIVGIFY